jgi:hypothetical protein
LREQCKYQAKQCSEHKSKECGSAGVKSRRPHEAHIAEKIGKNQTWCRQEIGLNVLDENQQLPRSQEDYGN